jgi:hypothetical protein
MEQRVDTLRRLVESAGTASSVIGFEGARNRRCAAFSQGAQLRLVPVSLSDQE